jgi:hypothetical protein
MKDAARYPRECVIASTTGTGFASSFLVLASAMTTRMFHNGETISRKRARFRRAGSSFACNRTRSRRIAVQDATPVPVADAPAKSSDKRRRCETAARHHVHATPGNLPARIKGFSNITRRQASLSAENPGGFGRKVAAWNKQSTALCVFLLTIL